MSLRLLLCSLLLSLLPACQQASDSGKTTLRLQAVADPVEAKAYRALIDAFEAQRPDVRVEFIPVGRHPEHVTRLTTAFAAGNAPDLFLINFRRWGQFIAADVLEPVGPLLDAAGLLDRDAFYAAPLDGFTYNGELVCMPQNVSSLVVYWNRALFAEYGVEPPRPDWRWSDFHDAAKALTRDLDGDRRPEIYGLDVDPSIVRLAPFVWQTGGRLVDDLEHPTRFDLRTPKAVTGLLFLKRLKNEVGVIPPLIERRAEQPDARFIRGGAAMTLNSRRFSAALRAVEGLDWDVAPLPRYREAASVLHADAYCLGRASRHKGAARDFIAFATGETGQALLSASGRIVPVRKSVAQSEAFLDPTQPPASAQVFLDTIPQLRRTPNIPAWYEIETRINPVIEEWMFESAAQMAGEQAFGLRDGYLLVSRIEAAAADLLKPEPAQP
ncbi:MAG: sugar ABC transporter substrate-binding protein [Pseudomonadota bacterium]|nr:sugar ABC transporter substrate-binding protein [Pseudomonadota bacterium]